MTLLRVFLRGTRAFLLHSVMESQIESNATGLSNLSLKMSGLSSEQTSVHAHLMKRLKDQLTIANYDLDD